MSSDQTKRSLDPNFLCYLRFYAESHRTPSYEADIRSNCSNPRKRAKRKEAETLVTGYGAFNSIRQCVIQQFKDAAMKVPQCNLVPILEDIDRSFECTFTELCEKYVCCITGVEYTRGLTMTLKPDPENPFGPDDKEYKIRSDFEEVLQAYRMMARFRYTVMKHITNHEGFFLDDQEACQKLYDLFLQTQKVLLLMVEKGHSI